MEDYGINKGFAGDFYAWHRFWQNMPEKLGTPLAEHKAKQRF